MLVFPGFISCHELLDEGKLFKVRLMKKSLLEVAHEIENDLYECALSPEKDSALNKEMSDWDITLKDGLNDETW